MRILIVDDSSATRTFLREALEARGYWPWPVEVVEADSGLEALRVLPRGPYDLVITDINMGGVNGLELLNFIRSHKQYELARVLLISTQQSDRDRDRGLSLGANAYLAKPFSAEALRSAVSELLSGGTSSG